MARDDAAREAAAEESLFDRRSYLQLFGAATTSVAVSEALTDSASAATTSTGFGSGGYGEGGYGGSTTESTLQVATLSADTVTASEATLNGEVTDLGGASSADVRFEYRPSGASTWTATSSQSLSATGTFSATLSGLQSGTDYEYRAVVAASDGDSATGTVKTFTTATAASAPAVDRLRVSEKGSPNPHATIDASWQVSDVDGDLQTVEVEVYDETGTLVRSASVGVSGGTASGSNSFRIKKGGGTTYECLLKVTDSGGRTASETRSVSA